MKYFASIREAIGCSGESVDTRASTLGDLRDELIALGGARAESLARGRAVRVALAHVMCDESVHLIPGCEVAFFPPVTGG
ncbi:MAG TPA: MoaD/ThiS family protein [Steroidobacter sp.]|uniref:MoaD/ThiS family protein n=1 Tax=Steroidobacter sp. TaxID=1978227 RepID=UPI002EDB1B3D